MSDQPQHMILVDEAGRPVPLPYHGESASVYDFREDGSVLASFNNGQRYWYRVDLVPGLRLISEEAYQAAQGD